MLILMFIIGALLILVAHYVIFAVYQRYGRTVISGCSATIYNFSLLPPQRRFKVSYDFLSVTVALASGGSEQMIVEVSRERRAKLAGATINVTVDIVKTLLGKPYIVAVKWPGESSAEPVADEESMILLSVAWLLLGIIAVLCTYAFLAPLGAVAQHAGLLYSALLFALSGYMVGQGQLRIGRIDKNSIPARVFNFPMGMRMVPLCLLFGLVAVATGTCFWYGGLLILFPGFTAAFSLGQLTALLLQGARLTSKS